MWKRTIVSKKEKKAAVPLSQIRQISLFVGLLNDLSLNMKMDSSIPSNNEINSPETLPVHTVLHSVRKIVHHVSS